MVEQLAAKETVLSEVVLVEDKSGAKFEVKIALSFPECPETWV